jgi:hypothetical protein
MRKILKWLLKKQDGSVKDDFLWLRMGGGGGGSCEHDNKPTGSINWWEFIQ